MNRLIVPNYSCVCSVLLDKVKTKTRRTHLVYDDEALERLLDRDALSRLKRSRDPIEESLGDFASTPIVFTPNVEEEERMVEWQEPTTDEETVKDVVFLSFYFHFIKLGGIPVSRSFSHVRKRVYNLV